MFILKGILICIGSVVILSYLVKKLFEKLDNHTWKDEDKDDDKDDYVNTIAPINQPNDFDDSYLHDKPFVYLDTVEDDIITVKVVDNGSKRTKSWETAHVEPKENITIVSKPKSELTKKKEPKTTVVSKKGEPKYIGAKYYRITEQDLRECKNVNADNLDLNDIFRIVSNHIRETKVSPYSFYTKLSTSELSKRIGVSSISLNKYFSNKSGDVVNNVVNNYFKTNIKNYIIE